MIVSFLGSASCFQELRFTSLYLIQNAGFYSFVTLLLRAVDFRFSISNNSDFNSPEPSGQPVLHPCHGTSHYHRFTSDRRVGSARTNAYLKTVPYKACRRRPKLGDIIYHFIIVNIEHVCAQPYFVRILLKKGQTKLKKDLLYLFCKMNKVGQCPEVNCCT